MGLCKEAFFDSDKNSETLFNRTSLSEEQEEHLKEKKDQVQEAMYTCLSGTTGKKVRFFIQGSYKNKTLIRPVRRGDEYDVDIGVYVEWADEEQGFEARELRDYAFDCLNQFSETDTEAHIEDNRKERCERIIFKEKFHIDLPVYHLEPELDERRLATLNYGWENSDPKSLQDWFTDSTEETQRHAIRRAIKYLKTWAALKWPGSDTKKLPSLVITVLVVDFWEMEEEDDDALIGLVEKFCEYFKKNNHVPNPLDGSDLLGFEEEDLADLRKKLAILLESTQAIKQSELLQSQYLHWTTVFEHVFPPLPDESMVEGGENLPAISYQPAIEAVVYEKGRKKRIGSYATDFRVDRDRVIDFRVTNSDAFPEGCKLYWMVRNQGKHAALKNDLGHHAWSVNLQEAVEEHTEYYGKHYMECFVIRHDSAIVGYNRIGVKIAKIPPRNPKKPSYVYIRNKR